MSRLKKNLNKIANENYTYTFESPIFITVYNITTSQETDNGDLEYFSECKDELQDAVNSDMQELGPRGLAQYLDDPLNSKVESIIISVENTKAITKVVAKEILTNEEINQLKDEIEGQFSDGWGEGFEQDSIHEEHEQELDEEEYNEALEQYEDDPDNNDQPYEREYQIDCDYEYNAHFWQSKGFELKQI